MISRASVASCPIKSFRDLVVWQRSKKLVGMSFVLARLLPPTESDLSRQIRRAAMSVPSNIAEGHGRFSRVDYARHVSIARGSLMELESLFECAEEVGYFERGRLTEPLKVSDEIGRMLWSLGRSLGSPQIPKSPKHGQGNQSASRITASGA